MLSMGLTTIHHVRRPAEKLCKARFIFGDGLCEFLKFMQIAVL